MRAALKLLAIILLVLVVGTATFLLDERNRSTLFGDTGSIEAGSKYGVSTNMSLAEASARLEHIGFAAEAISSNGPIVSCGSGGYRRREGQSFYLFREQTWRKGLVCLVEQRGHLVAIAWSWGWCPFCF